MADQKLKRSEKSLPAIPDKRYFTIGEVSQLCGVKPHVLRYWEQEFRQLRPSKRRGNRRAYQRKDVLMARKIRNLLYQQGFTINGAKQQLAAGAKKTVEPQSETHEQQRKISSAADVKPTTLPSQSIKLPSQQGKIIRECISELQQIADGLSEGRRG